METCYCVTCGDTFDPRRRQLGYQTCMDCGAEAAIAMRTAWTIVPLPKQGYTRVNKKSELKHLNQKSR